MAIDKLLEVEIVTPESKLFSGMAQSVSLPGSKSPFQVLYNHAPIVSTLDIGLIKIVDSQSKTLYFATTSGFCEVQNNKVSILVDSADNAADLKQDALESKLGELRRRLGSIESKVEAEAVKTSLKEIENKIKAVTKFKVS